MMFCQMTAFGHCVIPMLTTQALALPATWYKRTNLRACVLDLNRCELVDFEEMQALLILKRCICWLQLYRWGYQYVENLTWVYMDANNTILTTPSDYAQKSHLTLFIFRKEGKRVLLCISVQNGDAC